MTRIERNTRETKIRLDVARGTGRATVSTGQLFLDHMLVTLSRYSALDLSVQAAGDLKHHLIEDLGITFGSAIAQLASESTGITRYGDSTIAMDEALVQVVLDLGGRPFYQGPIPSSLYDHWLRSFADNARATVHVRVLRGDDRHHIVEAAFKALGFALRTALTETRSGVMSTKGDVQTQAGR